MININCGYGSTITGLLKIGLTSGPESSCADIIEEPEEFQESFASSCTYENSANNTLFSYSAETRTLKNLDDLKKA